MIKAISWEGRNIVAEFTLMDVPVLLIFLRSEYLSFHRWRIRRKNLHRTLRNDSKEFGLVSLLYLRSSQHKRYFFHESLGRDSVHVHCCIDVYHHLTRAWIISLTGKGLCTMHFQRCHSCHRLSYYLCWTSDKSTCDTHRWCIKTTSSNSVMSRGQIGSCRYVWLYNPKLIDY